MVKRVIADDDAEMSDEKQPQPELSNRSRLVIPLHLQQAATDGTLHAIPVPEDAQGLKQLEERMIQDDSLLLRTAACFGNLDDVKFCLAHGADLSAEDFAALDDAVRNHHFEVALYLISKGASLSHDNFQPYQRALKCGDVEVLNWLRQRGGVPN